jgi:outer membrane protein assembly factor BamB
MEHDCKRMTILRGLCMAIVLFAWLAAFCDPAHGAPAGPEIELLWKKAFAFGPAGVRAAIEETGAVFVGDDTGVVARLDARTGTEAWRHQSDARVRSAPILWQDFVIFGNGNGRVTALNKQTGEQVWTLETGGEVLGRMRVAGDVVYANSTDGYLYALYAWDGNIIWRYNMQQPSSTRPAAGGGMVICTGDRGRAAGLAPGERRVAWEYISGSSPLTSPLITDTAAVFAADRGALYGLDLAQGTYLWKHMADAPIPFDLASAGDAVYFTTSRGEAVAFDAVAQKEIWRVTLAGERGGAPGGAPAAAQRWLLVPFDNAELYALDLATGETAWSFRETVLAPGAFAGLSVGGDWIAAPNANGYLYLFRIAGGTAPAAVAAAADKTASQSAALLEQAKQAFLAGDYTSAAAIYRNALEADPGNHKAHYNLAVALEHVGGERYATPVVLDEAAEHYARALEIDPQFLPARINLGILYSKLQQNERAAQILREALAVREDKNVRYNLAVVLEKLGQAKQAREQWEAYLKLEDNEDMKNKIREHLKNSAAGAVNGDN